MKKFLLLPLLVALCGALSAQDLIVTTDNDSINCRILEIEEELMYFITDGNEEINLYLPMERVQSFTFGFYPDVEPLYKASDYARFRVAVAGGYSLRTFTILEGTSGESRDYQNRSRNGFHYGVELNYYFHRFMGVGITYYGSHFNPSGSVPEFHPYYITSKTRIQHIIPTFNVRVLDRQRRGALVGGIGIGYMDYYTKYYEGSFHGLTEKGWTVGILWSVGYEVPLYKTIAIYFQASLNAGVVPTVTIIDEETGKTTTISADNENPGTGLGKANLSIGLRFAQ
jgi:hypothetical protein